MLDMLLKLVTGKGKMIAFGLIGIAVAGIGWKVVDAFTERNALLEERKGTITDLTQDLTIASIKSQIAQDTIDRMETEKQRMDALYDSTLAVQREIRDEIRTQKDVFTKQREHTFEQLVNAKPGLIEKLANKATKERFNAFEHAFND